MSKSVVVFYAVHLTFVPRTMHPDIKPVVLYSLVSLINPWCSQAQLRHIPWNSLMMHLICFITYSIDWWCHTVVRLFVYVPSEYYRSSMKLAQLWAITLFSTEYWVCSTAAFPDITPFSDQLWAICMKFDKSGTNVDIPPPNHARAPTELPNHRNCLHYFRNACTAVWIGREKV